MRADAGAGEAATRVQGEIVYSRSNVLMGEALSRMELARGDEQKCILQAGDLGHADREACLHVSGRRGSEK